MDKTSNPFDVGDKVIIVTGSSGFLGQQYVRALLKAGAYVYSWDRDESRSVDIKSVDITNEGSVAEAVARIIANRGQIDGLVNNAAMNPAIGSGDSKSQFVPYEQYDIDLFRRELEVNLVGTMICIKHVAPYMIEQRSGSIVNVASEVSVIAHDHRVYDAGETKFKSPAYTASKTAVLGLTRQWAARLGRHGVRVNALSIGGVQRDGMPADFVERFGATTMLQRMAQPGEYCATLQYLLSDASSFMTGNNLIVDGGKHAW
ncbi:MAG: SDR family oxidoreductase [Candidatus Pacebacteria bacterium]|nr:SDR family oxidoreductase [Candidatus Paceibacterota bacterium]